MLKRKEKREEAEARQSEYNKLSIDKKIELVKSRGGSAKELARLEEMKKRGTSKKREELEEAKKKSANRKTKKKD